MLICSSLMVLWGIPGCYLGCGHYVFQIHQYFTYAATTCSGAVVSGWPNCVRISVYLQSIRAMAVGIETGFWMSLLCPDIGDSYNRLVNAVPA